MNGQDNLLVSNLQLILMEEGYSKSKAVAVVDKNSIKLRFEVDGNKYVLVFHKNLVMHSAWEEETVSTLEIVREHRGYGLPPGLVSFLKRMFGEPHCSRNTDGDEALLWMKPNLSELINQKVLEMYD